MNILVTLDANYIYPLTVMLKSVMLSNPTSEFTLFVVHSSLTEEDFKKIEANVDLDRTTINRVKIDNRIFEGAPIMDRVSKETYYRLLLTDYLPDSVKKILYLDPDIVVNGDLRQFYDMDISRYVLAAGIHTYGAYEQFNLSRLGMDKSSHYINAGVMLINVTQWRRYLDSDKVFAFISKNIKKLKLSDQDALNMIFEHQTLRIDERKFNLDEKTFWYYGLKLIHKQRIDLDWVRKNTIIIHYNGSKKPWKQKPYKGKLGEFFEYYAKRTNIN